jgi:hypothetical protein
MQDQIIDQTTILNKLIKATERALTKAVITNKQNEDLIQLATEKHKKKNKQNGTLDRARVIGGKVISAQALEEVIQEEFWKNNWEPKAGNDRSDFYTGFLQIKEDIFTWNSTHEQRQKANETRRQKAAEARRLKAITPKQLSKRTTKTRPLVQTPGAPIRPTTPPISQRPIAPLRFPIPLRSILQSPTPVGSTPQKRRRQSKVQARQRRVEENIPQEKVTHISKSGRIIYHKIRE